MVIQEFSDERRNIMIPRYPRLAHYVPTNALLYQLTGAYALIGGAYTHTFSVEGNEDVFVYFGGSIYSTNDLDTEQRCNMRIYETTTATAIAYRTEHVRFDTHRYSAFGMYNGMPVNKAGSPYTIECQAERDTGNETVRLQWPDFSVWMIRD